MNCLKARRKYDAQKENEAYLELMRREKEQLDKMTDEERKKYYEDKSKRQKQAFELLAIANVLDMQFPYK